MCSHVKANHYTGNSQRRNDYSTDESALACGIMAFAGENSLCVGLSSKYAKQETDAGSYVLYGASGDKAQKTGREIFVAGNGRKPDEGLPMVVVMKRLSM